MRPRLQHAVLALLVTGCATGPSPKIIDRGIVIEDVTLISPERAAPLELADVVISEGRIAQIGTNLVAGGSAQRVDGRGRYLIPGLIDTHVHIGPTPELDDEAAEAMPQLLEAYRAQLPRAFLAFGFTTIVDVDFRSANHAWFDAAPLRPRLFHCGRGLRIAGGYGATQLPANARTADFPHLVHEPAQAQSWPATLDPAAHTPKRAVERAVTSGAGCVKLFVEPGFGGVFDWPILRPETIRAIRAETERRGVPLLIHATGVEAWRVAIDARTDVIAHGLWHWPGNLRSSIPSPEARDVIEAAARANILVQPTLQVVYGGRAIFDWSILDDPRLPHALPRVLIAYMRSEEAAAARRALARTYEEASGASDTRALVEVGGDRASATLRLIDASGMRLLFGSDTGGGEGIGNPPGLNGRLELQRWADAHVSLRQILRAATLDNATMLGMADELGSIEVGKRADMLLLSANPLTKIEAYDAIETVFLNGNPLARRVLLPQN